MLHIHPNAHHPLTRAEIARSDESSSVLARRYGVSTETARKWRKRGLATASTALPARITCPGRRARRSAPSFVQCGVQPASPSMISLSCCATSCRIPIATASGASCGPKGSTAGPCHLLTDPPRVQEIFRDDDLGFVHIDIKHLPRLQTSDRERPDTLASSPSGAGLTPCTSGSRTRRQRPAPLRSCARPPGPVHQARRVLVPCFSSSHSPAPHSFSPVLSASRCMGLSSQCGLGRGSCSVSARRLKVVWSGTARSGPSRAMMKPIRPSVWPTPGNTALSVSAVAIARPQPAYQPDDPCTGVW